MRAAYSDTERRQQERNAGCGGHEGRMQTERACHVDAACGKAPADKPALKPYRGKPAVRNFRGDDGNVGIIRSPVRAIALPDRAATFRKRIGLQPLLGRFSDEILVWGNSGQKEHRG